MKIKEIKYNLFNLPNEYYLAHCISADYELGAGIAVEFQKRFHLRQYLHQNGKRTYPDCILVNKVFNLVTKSKYWNKPTYESLTKSLEMMRDIIVEKKIEKIAIYKLGCTRDRLQWGMVRQIIEDVFKDTDCKILVCKL